MGKLMGIKFRMIPWSYLIGNHMCRSGFISEPPPRPPAITIINVIKSDGLVKIYDNPVKVSALMMEFPDHKVCSSDSLYIGQKISPLPEDEQLQLGHNYFLLPTRFFHSVLTFVTIASFAANSKMINSNCQIFDIQKTESGFLRIRVRDDFISRLISEPKVDNKIAMMTNNNSATYSNIKEEKEEEEEEEEGRSSASSSRSSTNKNQKKKKKKKMMMMLSTNSSSSGGGGGGGGSSSDSQVCTTPQLQKEYKQLVLIGGSRRWKPKLEMIRETRNGEKKSSTSSRKVVLIPASVRRSINKLQKEYKQLVLIGGSRRWKPKLKMKRETRSGEKKSSTSSRKVVLIPASFRRRINKRSSSNSTTTTNHKMKKKSSQIPSESPSPHRHHLPVPPSSSSSSSSSTTTPPPAASKHKRRSSPTTPKLSS